MDLGSGTGLLGLVCSALGAARVVLTDVPQQLPLLRYDTTWLPCALFIVSLCA
jgi:predicted nicotinamide N-methyase